MDQRRGAPAGRHLRQESAPALPRHLLTLLRTVVPSAAGALALEAGTVFGSFTMSVGDLSQWMPKRILVLFVLLFPALLWREATRKDRAGRHLALPAPRDARTLLSRLLAPTAASVLAGLVAAGPVASLVGDPGDMRYGLALSAVLLAILLIACNHTLLADAFEWAFLILALCFGTTFCVLMPYAAEISWDGQTHFKRANALSYLFDAEYSGADQIMVLAGGDGGSIALTGVLSDIEEQDVELGSRTITYPHANLESEGARTAGEILRNSEETLPVVKMYGTQAYPSGSYVNAASVGLIPNAFGLWLGRLLHVPCTTRYLLGRLCNLIAYTLVFFVAIRRLRHGKLILAAIGLCPTTLLMAANYAADPWHISWIALGVAELVGALQHGHRLDARDSLRMLIPFTLGALVKAVVFPLALIFIIVPRRRFSCRRAWLAHLGLALLSVALLLASFALPFLVKLLEPGAPAQGDQRGEGNVNRAGQVAHVLAHPLETLRMSIVFALRMLNPALLGFGLSASDENLMYYAPYLTPATSPLNEVVAALSYLQLLSLSLTDGGPSDRSFKDVRYKVSSLVACALSFALICGALYVDFTAVGRDTISGVQYRYLLSLLAPLALLLPNTALRRRRNPDSLAPIIAASETVLLAAVLINSFLLQM